MSDREFQKRVDAFILAIVVFLFVVVLAVVGINKDSSGSVFEEVPGQEVPGVFYTETVPVREGQVECVALDIGNGVGLSCNWSDMRKED